MFPRLFERGGLRTTKVPRDDRSLQEEERKWDWTEARPMSGGAFVKSGGVDRGPVLWTENTEHRDAEQGVRVDQVQEMNTTNAEIKATLG